jgi:hypothetical protein
MSKKLADAISAVLFGFPDIKEKDDFKKFEVRGAKLIHLRKVLREYLAGK